MYNELECSSSKMNKTSNNIFKANLYIGFSSMQYRFIQPSTTI